MTANKKIKVLTQNEEEEISLWNEPGLRLIGQRELKLLGYREEKAA